MIDIGVVINLIKKKHCHDCDCLDVGDCYECDVYNIIEEIGDAFTEATKEREMKEHKKRFRIEFTVDVHNEGVTKEWDWSNDDIKEMVLQELDCMSPWPFDITFSEVENDWHTGTPTNEGNYRVALEYDGDVTFDTLYWSYDWSYFDEKYKILAWQKMELNKASEEKE